MVGDAVATARHRERGAVLPLVGIVLTTLILFASFALDLGYQRVMRRDLQALADVMALDLARQLDGRTESVILADPVFTAAKDASQDRNDDQLAGRGLVTTVELGSVNATGDFVDTGGGAVPTAVRVTAAGVMDNFFRPGTAAATRSAVGEIADNALARFRVGSSLVSVNPQTSSFIGQVLNDIVPGASVLSYQGLANANVGLQALGVALGVPIATATPEELLATNVGLNQLAVASAQVLQNQGDTAGATALNNLIAAGIPNTSINLGEALAAESGQGGPGLGSSVSVARLITTAAFLADGDHAVTIPASTLGIPGLASVGFRLTGIEAPREGGNTDGASATTQQLDLEITPSFNVNTATAAQQLCTYPSGERTLLNSLLGGLLNFLGCALGTVAPQALSVQVTGSPTLSLRLAEVTVSQSIDCASRQVTLTPTPASVRLLSNLQLDIQATLGTAVIPLLRWAVNANAVATGTSPAQTFTAVAPGTALPFGTLYTAFTPSTARVGANPLGLAGLLQVGPSTLQVLNLNLSTLASVVTAVIQPILNTILGQLDTLLLQPVAQLLGLNLGGSDLTQLWLQCDESAVRLSS